MKRTVLGAFVLGCAILAVPAARAAAPRLELVIPDAEERHRLLIGDRLTQLTQQPAVSPAEAALLATQNDYDVRNYFLDLDFDDVTRKVSGSVTITAQSVVTGLQEVVLDLEAAMIVSAVRRGASTPLTFSRSGNVLAVFMDVPVGRAETFEITVTYSGSPIADGSFGWNKFNGGGGAGQMVWSLSEPYGARIWWPCKDRPDDKATVQEWYTVKAGWTATGNGVLQGVDNVAGSRRRYRWAATHPLTTYLVSIAATDFHTFSDTYTPIGGGSMPLNYYVYPGTVPNAMVSFSNTPQMVEFFSETFGEYPFVEDQYGMSAFPFGGAMEHSTNTSYGYTLIDGSHNYDYIIAHELAHQWWGDSVSPSNWADIWLNEGFASHCEALWAEHVGGPASYRSYMNSMWRSSFSGTVYNPTNLFGATVYDKGAWVQHMLRRVLGDSGFFTHMQNWHLAKRDGSGTTGEYQARAEVVYGSSLSWFFQQWVYQGGSPTYQYGFKTANLGNGTYRNYVRIRQTQIGSAFTMPVELNLVTASGTELRSVWNDNADQDFILDTTQPLTSITFEPNSWILKTGATSFVLPDADNDGVPDRNDNCPNAVNPAQANFDNDLSGDICDPDDDNDTVADAADNCPLASNPSQANFDGDLAGDACDPDDDNDTVADGADCAPFDAAQGVPGEVASLSVTTHAGDLAWSPADRADSYDVSRGLVSALATSYGACLASGVAGTSLSDVNLPPDGDGFAYLVRGVDSGCGGTGSAGFDSTGTARTLLCP